MDSDYLLFRDATLFTNEVATYEISNVSSDVLVWDVTDHTNVKEMITNISNNTMSFNDSINELKEYIAFNNKNPSCLFKKALSIFLLENSPTG